MSKATNPETQQLAFRLTHVEVAWLQAEAERLSAETMLSVSMTAVVRRLIAMAMKGSPTVVPVAAAPAPAPTPAPAADPRQLAILGAVTPAPKPTPVVEAPAKVAKPAPAPTPAKVVEAPKTKPAAPKKTESAPDAAAVHAALQRALAGGRKQAEIRKLAGIDTGQMSRFATKGTGLSAAKLAPLAKVLGLA